ncbi:hypothetical protein L4D20_12075 [Vibrio kyushuensis]|uniref:hypothetical protein n=1 Tax=Vibrio TaxID=662 RepID=UPI003D12CE0A
MKYSWFCLPLFILGCNDGAYSPTEIDIAPHVSSATEESEPDYDVAYVDLNGDQLDDAVVLMKGINWCGSGGCTMFIFKNRGDDFQLISKSTVTRKPISVANTETLGWKDLTVWSRGKGLVLMSFDGQKYPRNPSLAPLVDDQESFQQQLLLE